MKHYRFANSSIDIDYSIELFYLHNRSYMHQDSKETKMRKKKNKNLKRSTI